MTALLRYTTLRLALFLIAFVVFSLVGLAPIYAAIVAIIVSAILSLFLLKRQREALSTMIADRSKKNRHEEE